MKISGQIFKNEKDKKTILDVSHLLETDTKLKGIIEGLNSSLSIEELAQNIGFKNRAGLNFRMQNLYNQIETIVPELKQFPFIDEEVIVLKDYIRKEWIPFIGKFCTSRNKEWSYVLTRKKVAVLCKKFYKPTTIKTSDLSKELHKLQLPMHIDEIAKMFDKKVQDILTIIDLEYADTFYVYKHYLISNRGAIKGTGVHTVAKNYLELEPDATFESFLKDAKEYFPSFLSKLKPPILENLKEILLQRDNESYRKYTLNEAEQLNSCLNDKKTEIIDICEKISLREDVCSTDAAYLATIVEEKTECKILPATLKALLMNTKKFVTGKKLVLAHHTKPECAKETFETMIENIIDKHGDISLDEIADIIHGRCRTVYKSNLYTAYAEVKQKKLNNT